MMVVQSYMFISCTSQPGLQKHPHLLIDQLILEVESSCKVLWNLLPILDLNPPVNSQERSKGQGTSLKVRELL